VFSDRKRWPDHLCYSDFMQESCEVWAFEVLGGTDLTTKLWASSYPLPISREAVRQLYASHGKRLPDRLLERLPLDGRRRALWALRVVGDRSVLDMFGLEDRFAPADGYLHFGGLAYRLYGVEDLSLLTTLRDAHDWWRDLSLEKLRGRPRGSGTFESREALVQALREAVRELRAEGHKIKQEAVAKMLHTDDAQLRKWLKREGLTWREVKQL
jgi:hypothetical protein